MRTLIIQIDDHNVRCQLTHGSLTHQGLIHLEHVTSWGNLLQQVKDALSLDDRPPPGLLTHGNYQERTTMSSNGQEVVWKPHHFTGVTVHGWAWGFWLPVKTGQTAETCCGFRTKEAALAAALALSTNLDRITGDLPNASYEPFQLDEAWAFLDALGQVHSTFPSARDAFAAASKHQSERVVQAAGGPN
ncbi:MAG: hypothetical protein IPK22_11380 [Verrucomicrobiaceae bacterium]|nr:hypothetical protein [Verrucomicrobiaceae bacterium]